MTTIQAQRQILAPALQQSIELLLLPVMDLQASIEQALQDNPMLETAEEEWLKLQETKIELQNKLEHAFSSSETPGHAYFSDDEEVFDRSLKRDDSLTEILLHQMKFEFSDPLDLRIGELIIGNINERGYLATSCNEIAEMLKLKSPERVERVLKVIQGFEPTGIASRNITECLMAQARERLNGNADLALAIIADHLPDLGRKRFAEIARKLNVSVDEVKAVARAVARLDPQPARKFQPVQADLYVKPDISIIATENGHQVQVNDDSVPRLRINPVYRRMLNRPNLSTEEKEFLRVKLQNALAFIKSIEQRGQTLQGIAEYILRKQSKFMAQGPTHLVPMSLKEVAQHLERNESTISRAVSHKYIDTPQGIFPMKFFFSRALDHHEGLAEGQSLSNRSIKEEIRQLIDNEDKSSPLSDQDIQKHFTAKGLKISRRTITKYRKAEKILPSHLRRE